MSTSTPNIGSQPVFSQAAATRHDGGPGDYTTVSHGASLALKQGTISLAFTIDSTIGRYALISKDLKGKGEGQFTLWVDNGALKLTIENGMRSKTLEADDLLIQAGQEYQVAFTFGTGAGLWVNGGLVAAEPTLDQGLDMNSADLLIGGSRAWTSASREPHALFRGEISDVHIYDKKLGQTDMLALAAHTDPTLDDAARMMVGMEDLAPVFAQLHHGSATLKSILSGYGVSEHGHIMRPLDSKMGSNDANTLDGTEGDDAINGKRGDDSINGLNGDDILQGHYGNDTVLGGLGDDILDGGHGEDSLNGGAGNDLLIAQADGREPIIAQDPSYAPHQMIPSNDILTGGTGADIFYFQTLINARREFIEKHTKDDGTINWHGVAG